MILKRPYYITCRNLTLGLLSTITFSAFCITEKDSVKTQVKLQEVLVNGNNLQTIRATMPVQIFSNDEFIKLNAGSVTDVAKHFAGITLKDYGGIGGLKTVSLRGMGTQHTGISYDGVILSNIQSGEIDLSNYSLDNISDISLCNGQPNNIFQTARMFASAGVLCLNTKLPEYNGKNELHGKATFKTGSFGLINPSLFLNQTLGRKWAMNLSIDGLTADGKYKFEEKDNQSEIKTRTNTDVKWLRTEANGIYRTKPHESFRLKVNLYDSERGLPGADILYKYYSGQRLWDKNFLSQFQYENRNSDKIQYQLFGRFTRTYSKYRDIDPKYVGDTLINTYLQREYYLSSALQYKPIANWSNTLSVDWWFNNLNINFPNFSFPTRHTALANAASKYITERWNLGANLLYTFTREDLRTANAAKDRNKLSPAVFASYKILEDQEFRIRAFYKSIFRLPTFNELYYQDMGNPNLRPETTQQYNIGMTYTNRDVVGLTEIDYSTDVYYNRVNDKIIAIPRDLFHFSMINKNKVEVKGIDINLKAVKAISKKASLLLRGNYTYQMAHDITPASSNYGEQIPYTPYHSGSGSLSFEQRKFEAGYNLLFAGKRWSGQNTIANRLDPFFEHSIFVSQALRWKKNNLKISGELINLFNTQYEYISNYPMPGRNYRITLSASF